MAFNPGFVKDEETELSNKNPEEEEKNNRIYSFYEAIDITGNGCYNFGLLATLSLALLAMALDMFSFAVVVTLSSCDLQLNEFRKDVLVSMPFAGAIIMAYAWGYISDTRGRRISLLVALSVSFVVSTISAFSSHWSMLAICRFVSTCFSSCLQSTSYTLIGESCPDRVKGIYMLVMTSIIHLNLCVYYPLAYYITRFNMSYKLGVITFVPWRLLVLILALPLGIALVCLIFFYESPKFLLNAGREHEALEVLENIYRRNGGDSSYPVKKLVLLETGNLSVSSKVEQPLLQSLWLQTIPLFRPPLLLKTLMLYYIIFSLYSVNSALFVWLPFLAESFSDGVVSHGNQTQGLCQMVHKSGTNINNVNNEESMFLEECTSTIDLPIVIAAVCAGCAYSFFCVIISKLAAHKRVIMITVFFVSFLSGIGGVFIKNNTSSMILYFGILLNSLNMGVVFTYCVDLYPTSFRGMAACLSVMVARLSGIAGVNITGPFISSDCEATFSTLSILMLSAAAMSYFLPRDGTNKT